ncbi:MAG: amidohydrolase family protein, partial [Candidatus Glassbacteria bacterium]
MTRMAGIVRRLRGMSSGRILPALIAFAFPALLAAQAPIDSDRFAELPKFDAGVWIAGFPDSTALAVLARKLSALNCKWLILPAGDSLSAGDWTEGAAAMAAAVRGRIFWVAPAVAPDYRNGWRPDQGLAGASESFSRGATALYFSRAVGMELQNADGSFVLPDDTLFTAFFERAEAGRKPVVIEAGERRNSWLPEESMDLEGDQVYFTHHLREHAYLRPGVPDYWRQIEARDLVVDRFAGVRFIASHLGSLEWSVSELAGRLERYPNLAVDLAGRLPHLQKQDREVVRRFLIEHQDQVIYASGIELDLSRDDPNDLLAEIMECYLEDYRWLATDELIETDYIGAGATV